jgi:hypothetical protein
MMYDARQVCLMYDARQVCLLHCYITCDVKSAWSLPYQAVETVVRINLSAAVLESISSE